MASKKIIESEDPNQISIFDYIDELDEGEHVLKLEGKPELIAPLQKYIGMICYNTKKDMVGVVKNFKIEWNIKSKYGYPFVELCNIVKFKNREKVSKKDAFRSHTRWYYISDLIFFNRLDCGDDPDALAEIELVFNDIKEQIEKERIKVKKER